MSDLQHLPHGHLLHFLSPTNQASVAAYLTLLQARQYKPCHHLLYSGGEFVRLYPVNPGQTSNYAARTKKAAVRAYKSALDI